MISIQAPTPLKNDHLFLKRAKPKATPEPTGNHVIKVYLQLQWASLTGEIA